MGEKKQNSAYNDFLDGEKLRDNNEIRTSLNTTSPSSTTPPPATRQHASQTHTAPKKPHLTHFLSLPVITHTSRPQLEASFQHFKSDLAKHAFLPDNSVRPIGSLHLTLGVMALDELRLEAAKALLKSIDLHRVLRDVTTAQPVDAPDSHYLSMNLHGLGTFQGASRTSVVYARPVDGDGRLVGFAERVRGEFLRAGLLEEGGRGLVLHATVVNTVYAKGGGRRGGKGKEIGEGKKMEVDSQFGEEKQGKDNESTSTDDADDEKMETRKAKKKGDKRGGLFRFDARTLLEAYKDFTWARDVRIDRVQICKMGARKIWSGGEEDVGEVVDEEYEVVCEKGIV